MVVASVETAARTGLCSARTEAHGPWRPYSSGSRERSGAACSGSCLAAHIAHLKTNGKVKHKQLPAKSTPLKGLEDSNRKQMDLPYLAPSGPKWKNLT